jgi:hypothetical protein
MMTIIMGPECKRGGCLGRDQWKRGRERRGYWRLKRIEVHYICT